MGFSAAAIVWVAARITEAAVMARQTKVGKGYCLYGVYMGYMEHKLKNRVCTTNDELWHQIQSVWDNIPMSLIRTLYDSMPKRLVQINTEDLSVCQVELNF